MHLPGFLPVGAPYEFPTPDDGCDRGSGGVWWWQAAAVSHGSLQNDGGRQYSVVPSFRRSRGRGELSATRSVSHLVPGPRTRAATEGRSLRGTARACAARDVRPVRIEGLGHRL